MKRALAALLATLLAVALCASCAAAQELPGVERFSPGLARLAALLSGGAEVGVSASFSADHALYVRDLSVLSEMLSGTTLRYDGGDGADRLRVVREGETLFDAALWQDGTLLLCGGAYALPDGALPSDLALDGGRIDLAELLSAPLFERAPLAEVAALLESLKAGDALPFGLIVARDFAVSRTMSDDGTRLTRIDISGAAGFPGQTPYEIAGMLRQPGGRAPKDTFEITLTQDEDDHFTLAYSSTRSSEITKRDKAGKATVQTALNSDGELGGYRINSRLSVRLTNQWTADEDGLTENISVTAHLGHTDRTPGRRMIRLNDLSADLRAALSLKTSDAGGPVTLADEASLSLTMDGNDVLVGAVQASVSAGENVAGLPKKPEPAACAKLDGPEALDGLAQDAAEELAAALYAQLGESSLAKIRDGLAVVP